MTKKPSLFRYQWHLCTVIVYDRRFILVWGNNLDKLVKKQGSYSWVHTTAHHISISNLQFKKNMFDLKKKCCCSDNQYNFDVPWENVWHSRFHLKVSKTCYNMLIYWKIKYDSIKKMFTLSWKISQIREKKTKPHLQQLLHYMKYDIFFLLPSLSKTCMYKVSSYKSNCHLYIR